MEPFELAIPLLAGFGAAVVSTPWVGRMALSIGAVDRPNDRKVSRRERMPLLGGLAVAMGVAAALVCVQAVHDVGLDPVKLRGLLLSSAVMLALGAIDDRYGVGARIKLTCQVLAAAIAIAHGFEIFRFANPFTGDLVSMPQWLVWIVTGFWMVGVTNALNLLDGLDGLACGVSAIMGTTLAIIAYQAGNPFGVFVGVALVGSLLGFLPHNFSPARIFLGDTGSLFVGFLLSLIALECYPKVSVITLMVPLLTLAVPLLDTSLSIVRRVRLRAPIFSADRLHMHHRLLASEGSARAAVLQFYFLTAAFCLIAVSFTRLEGIWAAVFFAAVVALTIRLLWNLGVLSPESDPDAEADACEGDLRPRAEEGES